MRGGGLQQPIGSNSNHSSPQMGYLQGFAAPQAPFMGYNMSRQSSNTSVPSSYHASPHLGQRQMMPMQMMGGSPLQQMPQMGMQGQIMGQQQMSMPMMAPQGQMMMQTPQMVRSPPNQGMMQPMMQGSPQNMMQNQQMGGQQQGQYFGLGYMPQGRPQ